MKRNSLLLAAAFAVCAGFGAQAQNNTYILDINKIYEEASTQTGSFTGATLNSGTKYLLNNNSYAQDIFTIVSPSNRTYRIDLVDEINYGDYTATSRLEPNGASNSTGGRQMFVEVANKGVLYIGASGNDGRTFLVMSAADKTSYIKVSDSGDATVLENAKTQAKLYHTFSGDAKDAVYSVELEPGIYCITQDQGLYYYYVKFVEGATIPTAISDIESSAEVVSTEYYNVAGARIGKPGKGINIVKTTMSDGSVKTTKVLY